MSISRLMIISTIISIIILIKITAVAAALTGRVAPSAGRNQRRRGPGDDTRGGIVAAMRKYSDYVHKYLVCV